MIHRSSLFLCSHTAQINPQHCVPTLDDNGLVLWDSHAISAYLVDKYAENDCLYPKDLNMRAKINQRLYFDSSVFFAALRLAQFPIFTRGATDVPTHVIDSLYSAFDFLETFLQHDDYLVGNSVTIADLCCVATAYSCLAILDLNNGKYPRVLQWIDRLFELSYVKEVNGNSAKGFRDLIQKQKDEKKA